LLRGYERSTVVAKVLVTNKPKTKMNPGRIKPQDMVLNVVSMIATTPFGGMPFFHEQEVLLK
jgi:hypothetical protein